jgi:predicted RNase H-like HicB family nuclease
MELIRVIYHREEESWWAESPDVKGWLAAADDYAEILKPAEEGIPFALEREVGEVELEHVMPTGEHLAA